MNLTSRFSGIFYAMKFLKYTLLFFAIFELNISIAQPFLTVKSKKQYIREIKSDDRNTLVDLQIFISTIVLDLKYATIQNFTQTNLYKKATTTYLRKEAAQALKNVANELLEKKYYLKVYDAYRPFAATCLMWDLIKDERYVANPAKGSNHNRGLAIDLTIVDEHNKELNMGTGFDHFSDTAHHSFKQLPKEVLDNRFLLKTTMEKHGFKALDTEWWHYSFITKEAYSILDLPFNKLKRWIQ